MTTTTAPVDCDSPTWGRNPVHLRPRGGPMTYFPELGQMLRGGEWQEHAADAYTDGICVIADAIEAKRGDDGSLASNYGCEPYEGDTFAMRTYCWCEEEGEHSDGCPPNFETRTEDGSPLIVRWYKHAGRGISANRIVSPLEWARIVARCLSEVAE